MHREWSSVWTFLCFRNFRSKDWQRVGEKRWNWDTDANDWCRANAKNISVWPRNHADFHDLRSQKGRAVGKLPMAVWRKRRFQCLRKLGRQWWAVPFASIGIVDVLQMNISRGDMLIHKVGFSVSSKGICCGYNFVRMTLSGHKSLKRYSSKTWAPDGKIEALIIPWKLTNVPWKSMLGRCIRYWNGYLLGASC